MYHENINISQQTFLKTIYFAKMRKYAFCVTIPEKQTVKFYFFYTRDGNLNVFLCLRAY